MIRNSIVFLAFFIGYHPFAAWGQDAITFDCYNIDSISWILPLTGCSMAEIDSFRIYTRTEPGADFQVLFSGSDPAVRGFKNESLKSDDALILQYFLHCPDEPILQSDTLSLADMRDAVQLDSVRVLANGNVRLQWKEKPISGIRYVVNTAVGGSSNVLATDLSQNTFTDTRGRADENIEYYSISAALGCGYTFPEPDSFYHTSLLTSSISECGGQMHFDFTPFSYWKSSTTEAILFVIRNGEPIDSVELTAGQTSFLYSDLHNQSTYTFYVRESGADPGQSAFSNPVTVHTNFYEPIRWIVIDDLSFDDNNEATISWSTNEHTPEALFALHTGMDSTGISKADLISHTQDYHYGYSLSSQTGSSEYAISLQDSCGNLIVSRAKAPLFTQGQLSANNSVSIQWSDIADDEWIINTFDIYYLKDGSYTLLGTVAGSDHGFEYDFGDNQSQDSLCYYVVANGEVHFQEIDSTAPLQIRSNRVCLYGETVVELPNAFHPNSSQYKPIIVPNTNLTSYFFRVFDRYGNLVFESRNPQEGWDGTYQGQQGFAEVFVAQVKFTTVNGEKYDKSGSVLLFH